MAKIKIEADTETMTITCAVDGEELTNLHSISLYQYPETSYSKPKLEFNACSMEKKESGVTKTMYVYADKLEKHESWHDVVRDHLSLKPHEHTFKSRCWCGAVE